MSSGRRPRTVVARLAVVRSLFSYLVEAGHLSRNSASAKLVPPPKVPASAAGRALSKKEVLHILTAPDRRTPEGQGSGEERLYGKMSNLSSATAAAQKRWETEKAELHK
jgi:site-specific recombinase XerC